MPCPHGSSSAERCGVCIQAERDELRTRLTEAEAENDQWQKKLAETWAEIEPLRAALVQIENWVGRLPSNMGEAALIFEYIGKACSAALDRSKD